MQETTTIQSIPILLVDDHEALRSGLRLIIESDPRFRVVAEAGSGAEALYLTPRVSPSVVVMDVGLEDGDGIEFGREIIARHPEVKVLIFSSQVDEKLVQSALNAGAKGYIVKT